MFPFSLRLSYINSKDLESPTAPIFPVTFCQLYVNYEIKFQERKGIRTDKINVDIKIVKTASQAIECSTYSGLGVIPRQRITGSE